METAQDVLVQLDKEILQYLKTSIESREKARIYMNPFDIKIKAWNDKHSKIVPYNVSYWEITESNLRFICQGNPLTNIKYICMAMGNESGEEGAGHFIRNHALEELFMTEDEMHEIDISIHRFEWILNLLQGHKKSKNEANSELIIRKLENFKILTLLYGKKVLVIKEALQNKLSHFLPIIIHWVS